MPIYAARHNLLGDSINLMTVEADDENEAWESVVDELYMAWIGDNEGADDGEEDGGTLAIDPPRGDRH